MCLDIKGPQGRKRVRQWIKYTPWNYNMEVKNGPLEDPLHLQPQGIQLFHFHVRSRNIRLIIGLQWLSFKIPMPIPDTPGVPYMAYRECLGMQTFFGEGIELNLLSATRQLI